MLKTVEKTGCCMYSNFAIDPAIVDTTLLVRDTTEPSSVKKNGDYVRWNVTDDILKYFDGLNYIAGNIYYHTTPYEVHTDVFTDDIGVNVLIPLEREGSQKFIVFDQTYHGSTVWKPGNGRVEQRELNTIFHGRPCETPVEGLTGLPCGLAKYLPEEDHFYDGLSGSLIEWEPGEGLVFPSINLHATGIMDSPKYGLAMWFNNTVEEICSHFEM